MTVIPQRVVDEPDEKHLMSLITGESIENRIIGLSNYGVYYAKSGHKYAVDFSLLVCPFCLEDFGFGIGANPAKHISECPEAPTEIEL